MRIRLRRASPSWPGSNGAITRRISRIVSAERQRAKESGVVGLEGSCQEGKHPPYTPFCIFCRGMSHGISLPICRFARTRVFSDCDVTRSMATHQTPIRIKAHDGRLALWPGIRPLAHIVPQKTLGTLPCPIVTSTVYVALPEGSTPKLARGRGVAKTRQVAWRPSVRG